ncbi:hypothetical protein An16g02410 [Aspergillus niger]|uniref:Uncharacterized protein n=2 Tax=Aspergillus niger TaxID=5061 RepID=A2R762_ASPNC|nr:hypothetical protein An16g02410 [Aspergillus niger]CAL00465.1 hypothetical protein An16g02410 [Aspergillus niger]
MVRAGSNVTEAEQSRRDRKLGIAVCAQEVETEKIIDSWPAMGDGEQGLREEERTKAVRDLAHFRAPSLDPVAEGSFSACFTNHDFIDASSNDPGR